VLLATVVALAVAWGIGRALGMSVYAPLNELALDTLATAPAVLLFPLVLWATRFFTPGERRKLAGAARRLTGRPAAQVAADGAEPAGALAVAAGAAAGAGAAGMAPAEPCDHACVDELSEDDLAAEEEELEMEQEADIDLTEGPTTSTMA
jgi:hypothetical protein